MVLAANLFMSPRDNRNARLLAVGLSSGAGFTWKTLTSCSRPSMVILKGGSSKSWPGHFLWAWKCYGDLHREHDDKPWHGMRLTIFSDKAAEVSFSGWNHLFWRKKNQKSHATHRTYHLGIAKTHRVTWGLWRRWWLSYSRHQKAPFLQVPPFLYLNIIRLQGAHKPT